MRPVFATLVIAGALFSAAACRQEEAEAAAEPQTVVVSIQSELNVATQARVAKAIRLAEAAPGGWLIITIDTPGGDIETMGAMGNAIREASSRIVDNEKNINTVAFVTGGPSGGAWSAGSFLAIACDKLYMAPNTFIGAALPVMPGLTPSGFGIVAADKRANGKIVSHLAARFRNYAKQTNRPPGVAAAFVDPDLGVAKVRLQDGSEAVLGSDEIETLRSDGKLVSVLKSYQLEGAEKPLTLDEKEAFDCGLSQGIVKDLDDLLKTIGRESAPIERLEPFAGERFVELISIATPVLILLGIVLGFLESKIQGFGLAGVLSTLCFGLVFYGRYLLGAAEILHFILFALGILLLAVEFFLAPGTFYAGAMGVIFIIGSLLLSFQDFIIPKDALDAELLKRNLAWGLAIFMVAVVISYFLARIVPSLPGVRSVVPPPPVGLAGTATEAASLAAIVGKEGVAATLLRPAGAITVGGDRFDAVAEGSYIPQGAAVRVIDVAGSSVVVRQLEPKANQ